MIFTRWAGYNEQSWAERFTELDRRYSRLFAAHILAPQSVPEASFQARVEPWLRECFPTDVCNDKQERGDRFLEEALELLQAGGYDRSRVTTLVDYVWNRPVGEPSQEVGGVMVTLAAYSIAHCLDMSGAAETELLRISQPEIMKKIRAKQASKRGLHSPLPAPPQSPPLIPREPVAAEIEKFKINIKPVNVGPWIIQQLANHFRTAEIDGFEPVAKAVDDTRVAFEALEIMADYIKRYGGLHAAQDKSLPKAFDALAILKGKAS